MLYACNNNQRIIMSSAPFWDLFDILLINHYKSILCIGKGNSTELILKQQYPILKTIIPS